MDQIYERVSYRISRLITREYSTSFSSAISFLPAEKQKAIHSIYGFVRLADEIVDTFHECDQKRLLEKFESDYDEAFTDDISLNPVLHAFQLTVKKYRIPDFMIRAFLKSMKYDLVKQDYLTDKELKEYIYGSADVVGLMCLKVFTDGNEQLYQQLLGPAMKLGTAFQKVNFLRDLKADTRQLNRNYFPQFQNGNFNETIKQEIIRDIHNDFSEAFKGISKLPGDTQTAVLLAFYYYYTLLKKINGTSAGVLIETRIRISGFRKFLLVAGVLLFRRLKLM